MPAPRGWSRARKAIAKGEPLIPLEVLNRIANGESAIRVVREWRGVTQVHLAHEANIGQGHISDLENGRRKGTTTALKGIARVLNVPLDLLA